MVFDVAVHNGENITGVPFWERLKHIGEIVGRYRSVEESCQVRLPFELIGKKFVDKKDIKFVFGCIKPLASRGSGEQKYVYVEGRRNHLTDGIIFAPNVPYQTSTNMGMLKWKYPTCWTVDLAIPLRPDGAEKLCCGGPGQGLLELMDVDFSAADSERFHAAAAGMSMPIAECAYNPTQGRWQFCKLRTDKPKANNVVVIVDTLKVLLDNVSRNELIYRTTVDAGEDKWESSFASSVDKFGEKMIAEAKAPPKQRIPSFPFPQ
jgi:mRNA guanylyltransferase